MKKWNKSDTNFMIKSLIFSVIAILIWLKFDSYVINNNYFDISLNEKDAKQKALQYIGSRGWDISGYTYTSRFDRMGDDEYIVAHSANNDKDVIKKIDKLGGFHRWNMRWFNPPNEHEIHISYTKDGDLAYFERTLPDTLAGDSLPENIANNIAKMFMKNMIDRQWDENDWELKQKYTEKKKNRLDYYFQWENNQYKFNESTIRMSLRVHGNEVVRYNRWNHIPDELNKQAGNWDSIRDFVDDINDFTRRIIFIVSILIALFYYKIQTNWKIASRYSLFIVIINIINGLLYIPVDMHWFDSEDTLIESIISDSINVIVMSIFTGFIVILIIATFEKLYRKTFPHFISFSNLFNPRGFSSKLFFNNYIMGIVFGLYALALSAIYNYGVFQSGHYIKLKYLNNDMLTANPLIYLLTECIDKAFQILPFVTMILLIHLLIKSKWASIIISALLFGLTGTIGADPIFLDSFYFIIISIMGGYLLFKYGILSVFIFSFSSSLFNKIVYYFYTGEADYITTGIIAILLLLTPAIYCLLHYLKFRSTTDVTSLLNSAENISEVETSKPSTPKLEQLSTTYNIGAIFLFVIGISCLLITSNDELKDFWSFKISKSTAIDEAIVNVEKNYDTDLSKYRISTNHHSRFRWYSYYIDIGPVSIISIKRSFDLAYLMEKIGRSGTSDLFKRYNLTPNGWNVKFFIPDYPEYYYASINPRNKELVYYYHHLSDTINKPSVSQAEAEAMMIKTLQSQNIDVANLPIHNSAFQDKDGRLDYQVEYEKKLLSENNFTINEIIKTGVSGNLFTEYSRYFKIPKNWQRDYHSYNALYIFMFWGSLVLWVLSIIIGLAYLIRNCNVEKYELSWKLMIGTIIFNASICILNFINDIPLFNSWNYGDNKSWLSYWLDDGIGGLLDDITMLNIFIIIPIYCMYLIYPKINNLFSKISRETYSKDAFFSSIATLGATCLYYPIKHVLYANFPNYIENSISSFDFNILSSYFPGLSLSLTIIISSIWIIVLSLFYYNKYMQYSSNGENIKKYLIIIVASIFYMFSNSFWSVDMLPHFIAKFSGLVLFLLLIKYFWKNNPLSHLFGVLIYFHLDRIFNFIHLTDPSIKSQGYLVLILLGVLFIYSVGLETFRNRFSSSTS